MRKAKLNKNRKIIKFKNDYFVVDNKTADILEIIENSNDINDFVKNSDYTLEVAKKKVNK